MLKPVEIEAKNWKHSIGTELIYSYKSKALDPIKCRVIGYHYGTPDRYQLCHVPDILNIWDEERNVVDIYFDICLSSILRKL